MIPADTEQSLQKLSKIPVLVRKVDQITFKDSSNFKTLKYYDHIRTQQRKEDSLKHTIISKLPTGPDLGSVPRRN